MCWAALSGFSFSAALWLSLASTPSSLDVLEITRGGGGGGGGSISSDAFCSELLEISEASPIVVVISDSFFCWEFGGRGGGGGGGGGMMLPPTVVADTAECGRNCNKTIACHHKSVVAIVVVRTAKARILLLRYGVFCKFRVDNISS